MKKIFTLFAIMMVAITASAKVYEVDLSKVTTTTSGKSITLDGVVITVVNGMINKNPITGLIWTGGGDENSFQISTESGETITCIEITGTTATPRGEGWTSAGRGTAVWTGSETTVTFGKSFNGVTKLTVTVEDAPAGVDDSALREKIAEASAKEDPSEELQKAIAAAGDVLDKEGVTQAEIDAAVQNLEEAIGVFNGINTVSVSAAKVAKAMVNGKVVILKNGKTYNVAGQEL